MKVGTREQLGSVIEIKVPEEHADLLDLCFAEIQRIEQAYSRFRASSELSHINAHLGRWQSVSSEFIELVTYGLAFGKHTNGHFDLTVKSELDRLGYDAGYSFIPKTRPNKTLREFAHQLLPAIRVDKKKRRLLLRKQIDFGGLGKGYALDCVAKILDTHGVQKYYINAGGDIRVRGTWEILLEHPEHQERALGKITLIDGAIAGSAANRRRWGSHHHLINAKTRMPEHSVLCVFVLAKTGIEADAYATSIFTAGFVQGVSLSKKLPIEVLMVSAERKMYQTEGFRAELYSG